MRRWRTLGTAAVLAATALLAGPVGSQAAGAPAGNTEIKDLSFSTSGFSLRGTQLRAVDVSVHLADPDGIPEVDGEWADGGIRCPCLVLSNVRQVEKRTTPQLALPLHLVSGSSTDGVWRARFLVGAAQAGFWQPVQIQAGDLVDDSGSITSLVGVPAPWRQVTLNVRGIDWPHLWLGTRTRLRPGVDVVRGGVYLIRSRTPIRAARVTLSDWCDAANGPFFVAAARTNAAGRYAFRVSSHRTFTGAACSSLEARPSDALYSFVASSSWRKLPKPH